MTKSHNAQKGLQDDKLENEEARGVVKLEAGLEGEAMEWPEPRLPWLLLQHRNLHVRKQRGEKKAVSASMQSLYSPCAHQAAFPIKEGDQ